MELFRVVEPGAFTTVQDLGRFGYQQYGIPVSGALDQYAARAANLLVGNPEGAALLEATFLGPKLLALAPAVVAVTGAEAAVLVNGQPRPLWESFALQAGDLLETKPPKAGLRLYIATAGGLATPVIMGSRSTYVGGKLGGPEGRALVKGDVLPGQAAAARPGRSLAPALRPVLSKGLALRALPGPQDDYFAEGLATFFGSEFKVSAKADRMGYRLEGPVVELKAGVAKSIISEPSLAGAVQIPADGQPIVLLVEQTVGGYCKIATVLSPDLDAVAQAKPGDAVRFTRVDLGQAQTAHRDYQARLAGLRQALTA